MKIKKNKNKLQAKRRNKKTLHILDAKIPVSIYISITLGILSALSFIVMCIISAICEGQASVEIAYVPMIAVVCNITGLFIAYRCFKMDDVRDRLVSVANILNCTLIILYMILYIIGMVF